jgi:hypothetical protein
MRARIAHVVLACCVLALAPASLLLQTASAWAAGSLTGVAGSSPAYYDHELFTINLTQLTTAQATLLAKNSQQNTIYESDPGLPGGKPFIPVIDAIPADGMNPLWAEVQIAFTAGNTPRQLFSDDEIAAAFHAGEITLTATNEMYRCAVTGVRLPLPLPTRSVSAGSAIRGSTQAPGATSEAPVTVSSWGAIKIVYR